MDEKFLKLTNTVYKVLEFFPESDPLKNRAKDKALAIMEHLILLNKTKRLPDGRQSWATLSDIFSEEKVKVKLLEDIDILLGYLWIGKTQGWLNSANCLILTNEYEKIKREVGPAMVLELTQKLPGIESKRQGKPDKSPEGHFDGPATISDPKSTQASLGGEEAPVSVISDRQRKIIDFLVKNEKAQVMDLQAVLPDITKRTIRRDLDELLATGKIVRMGDFNQVFYKIKG